MTEIGRAGIYLLPAEFLKWTCPPSTFRTVQSKVFVCQHKNLIVASHVGAGWPGSDSKIFDNRVIYYVVIAFKVYNDISYIFTEDNFESLKMC